MHCGALQEVHLTWFQYTQRAPQSEREHIQTHTQSLKLELSATHLLSTPQRAVAMALLFTTHRLTHTHTHTQTEESSIFYSRLPLFHTWLVGPSFSSQAIISPLLFAYGLFGHMGIGGWLSIFWRGQDRRATKAASACRAERESTW